MKYSLTLNQAELSQAVADFVAKKVGVEAEVKVTFDIEIKRDYFDNSVGNHISATVTYEAKP